MLPNTWFNLSNHLCWSPGSKVLPLVHWLWKDINMCHNYHNINHMLLNVMIRFWLTHLKALFLCPQQRWAWGGGCVFSREGVDCGLPGATDGPWAAWNDSFTTSCKPGNERYWRNEMQHWGKATRGLCSADSQIGMFGNTDIQLEILWCCRLQGSEKNDLRSGRNCVAIEVIRMIHGRHF